MRCETCDRPILSNRSKREVWVWAQILAAFLAVFCLGAIVETIVNLDLYGFLAVTAGYTVGVAIMFVWWAVAAKDY